MEELIKKIVENESFRKAMINDNYKMKSVRWYHRLWNNVSAWITTIMYLPKIIRMYRGR